MYFRFWGTRGSIPTPGPTTVHFGGNTSCVEVGAEGALVVLDAGTGIRGLGEDIVRRGDAPKEIHLLITHTHWDHIQGFPYFLPAFIPDYTIRIYGCQGTGNKIEKVLAQQMDDDFFPLSFRELSAKMVFTDIGDEPFQIGPIRVEFTFVNHPGLSLGYALTWGEKKIVYCPDVEPFRQNVLSDDTELDLKLKTYVDGLDRKVVDLARGADCLLIDGTYTEEEYEQKLGWGHSSYVDSVRVAMEAGVKRLFLVHHDPSHADDFISDMVGKAQKILTARGSSIRCEGAREGETVQF